MTHYKLTDETIVNEFGTTLYRIELTKDCVWGKAGTKGGYIEKESNLSGNARVYGNARVSGDAQVSGTAQVFRNAQVYGTARVFRNALVYGDARVSGTALVYGTAWVYGNAQVEVTSDYITISSLGNSARTITITFSDKMIAAGCFRGTLAEFKAAVNSKYNGEGNYYPTIAYIETLFNQKNK